VTIGRCDSLNLEEARLLAERPLREGIRDKRESTELTLQDALDAFLSARQMRSYTKQKYRNLVERHLADWLTLPLQAITKDMVEERHLSLLGPTRCGTEGKSRANATFEVLRGVLNWAADRYLVDGKPLLLTNPVDRLKQNKQWFHLPPRQGVIPDNRLADFYKAVIRQPKIARDYILFLLLSGLRRREAARLKWADIDFEKGTLTIAGALPAEGVEGACKERLSYGHHE